MRKRITLLVLALVVAGAGVFWWTGAVAKKPAEKATTAPTSPVPAYLVSLGDSVAAGAGLPVGSSTLANQCGQSGEAYPFLVAQSKSLKLEQFACSGATVTNGILQPQVVGGQNLAPQLAAATPYIKHGDVLITIGANDVDWDNELYLCVTTNCETASNLATFQQKLSQLSANLAAMLQTIQGLHPHTVLLNTYYPLLTSSDTCLANRGISRGKVAWVNARETELNAAITAAANKYGGHAVTITFGGHLLCDPVSWVQGLSSSAPLHPTADGQADIAQQDQRLL